MKNTPESPASTTLPSSKNWLTTTPTMRRFLIGFTIIEAVMIGWALASSYLR